VEVVAPEMEGIQLPLCQQRGERVAVLLRAAGVGLGQHDLDLGLTVCRERDPAESVVRDLAAHGESEGVAVEGDSSVGVVNEYMHGADGNGHADNPRQGQTQMLLRSCSI